MWEHKEAVYTGCLPTLHTKHFHGPTSAKELGKTTTSPEPTGQALWPCCPQECGAYKHMSIRSFKLSQLPGEKCCYAFGS